MIRGCLLRGFRVLWRRTGLARAEEGMALVEFSLVFPILLILFVGTVEFSEGFAVNRKLTNAASTVSDLVAQVPQVSDADLSDIAEVAETLMQPYQAANLGLVVTSVEADADNNTTVGWSYAHGSGATARTGGTPLVLPAGLTEPNSSVIVAETSYQFTPTVAYFLTGDITLTGRAYFRPRVSRVVEKVQ
jgi:Flp pilus assembly protein TadG